MAPMRTMSAAATWTAYRESPQAIWGAKPARWRPGWHQEPQWCTHQGVFPGQRSSRPASPVTCSPDGSPLCSSWPSRLWLLTCSAAWRTPAGHGSSTPGLRKRPHHRSTRTPSGIGPRREDIRQQNTLPGLYNPDTELIHKSVLSVSFCRVLLWGVCTCRFFEGVERDRAGESVGVASGDSIRPGVAVSSCSGSHRAYLAPGGGAGTGSGGPTARDASPSGGAAVVAGRAWGCRGVVLGAAGARVGRRRTRLAPGRS
jgi:hypothetical protein